MKWIDTTNIRSWAARRDCQQNLPLLVRKLVRATTSSIKNISFPSGENVLMGGWDGLLEVNEETTYIPLGQSVWEFGANSNVKTKADDDYDKRKQDTLGIDPKNATYIFVTPRLWTKKGEWIDEKNKEGFWKEVRVYDAENLEEWIDTTPSVGAWLAVTHLSILPRGIQPADDFWEEWSTGTKIKFIPDVVLAGRKQQIDSLISKYQQPSIIPVKASSREEATAFIIAAFKNDNQLTEDFFSKALIIDSPEAFREIMVTDKSLYLIVRFDDDNIINRARSRGHVVYVPLGIDNSGQYEDIINLPALDRDEFLEALIKSGLKEEEAEKISKRSARNLSVVRRQLEFNRLIPEWAHSDNVRELIPALLAGRWVDDNEEDIRIIEYFAGQPYNDYIATLQKWIFTSDAPVVKIGNSWRLTSPLDAWMHAGKYCTKSDLSKLEEVIIGVYGKIDPIFELSVEDRQQSAWQVKKISHSKWLREGLVQSLIITSFYGDKIEIDLDAVPAIWVDQVIHRILSNRDPNLWKSLDNELPLLAEASPSAFLSTLETLITIENGPIHKLFDEEKGWLDTHSYHTGLLWALEGLAWDTEYLSRVSLILTKLAEIDPGGRLSNRPINSLFEIFKSWLPQTLSNLDNRFEALKVILNSNINIGSTVIKSLLPDGHSVSHPTHKMRWRLSDKIIQKGITYDELNNTYSQAIDLLIKSFDFTENSFSDLTVISFQLNHWDREKVLDFLEEKFDQVDHSGNITWHNIRKTVSRHRSSPGSNWAIPETGLDRYQKLYDKLTPSDPIDQISWILEEAWPQFIEGRDRNASYEDRSKLFHARKVEVVKFLYDNYGIDKLLDFGSKLKNQELNLFAAAISDVIIDEGELLKIWEGLKTEGIMNDLAQFVAFWKSRSEGIEYLFQLFESLKQKGFQIDALINILQKISANEKIWDFVESYGQEAVDDYWQRINEYNVYGSINDFERAINMMMKYNRNTSALKLAHHKAEDLNVEMLMKVLFNFIGNDFEKDVKIDDYEIQTIFDEIQKKGVDDRNELIKLEWLFLPFLDNGYNNTNTPSLHHEMSDNPDFFIQVLEQLYIAKSDEELEPELTEEQITLKSNMAHAAYKLLSSWKTIPGVDSENNIDEAKLNGWVDRALLLAEKSDRLVQAKGEIGTVLGKFPENIKEINNEEVPNWPPESICEVIEKIDSETLFNNFQISIYNKRGFSSRGPFDGGERERQIATYFRKISKSKSPKFPKVAAIFESLAKDFEQQGKREDHRAERDKLDY